MRYIRKYCSLTPILLALFLSLGLNGCAGVYRYYLVAVPVADVNGSGITKKGVINLDDLNITLRPSYRINIGADHTHYKPSQYGFQMRYYRDEDLVTKPPKFFYIDILIKSNVAGISFDPTKVVLINKNKERVIAFGYAGPLAINSRNNYALSLCKPRSTVDSSWPKLILYTGKDYCFAVRFDVPPTVDTEFSLELNGIFHGGIQLHIPAIRYTTETITHYES